MPADDPFTKKLFPEEGGDLKDPGVLYARTIALFPTGSYRSNPLNDPASNGTGLGTWWASTWKTLESALPSRKQLSQDAQFDRNWVDEKVGQITDSITGLESSQSPKDRRGYADLALQKLAELQAELPLDALATVAAVAEAASAFRDASFTIAKGVVALALNADRPGETMQDTYRQLELTDIAATHYWLGGDVPEGVEISKGEMPAAYFGVTSKDFEAPDPAGGRGNVVERFGTLLYTYATAQNSVNSLRALPNRSSSQDAQLTTARGALAKAVDDVANLTKAFADQTGELAAKDPKSDEVVQSAVTAMLFAESMRSLTGVTRPSAQPGAIDDLTPAQTKDVISAGTKAASELPAKFEEREAEDAGSGI